MARLVFVDTSAFVGYFVEKDQHHRAAVACFRELQAAGTRLLTTTDVIDETVTRTRMMAGHGPAVAVGEWLRESRVMFVEEIDSGIGVAAWQVFRKHADRELSLTDCTSISVMKMNGLTEVFTFDSDFDKVGFTRLPVQRRKR